MKDKETTNGSNEYLIVRDEILHLKGLENQTIIFYVFVGFCSSILALHSYIVFARR